MITYKNIVDSAQSLSYNHHVISAKVDKWGLESADQRNTVDMDLFRILGGEVQVQVFSGEQSYILQTFFGDGLCGYLDLLFLEGKTEMALQEVVLFYGNIEEALDAFDALCDFWDRVQEACTAAMLTSLHPGQ